jgi:hypothetical protein
MARQYKVRLGDGTLLAVDLVGLRAWLHDDKARVQRVGSRRWRTLKEMIEAETAKAAADAARPRPSEPPTPPPKPPWPPDASIPKPEDGVAKPGHNVPILPPDGLEEEIAAAAEPAEEEIPIPAEDEEFAIPPDEEVAIPTEPTELPPLARSAPVEPLAAFLAKPVATVASKPTVAVPKPVAPAAKPPVAVPKPIAPAAKPPVAVPKPPVAVARPPAAPAPPKTAPRREQERPVPLEPFDLGDVARSVITAPFVGFTPLRSTRPPMPDDGMPIIPFKPLEDEEPAEEELEELDLIEEKEPVRIHIPQIHIPQIHIPPAAQHLLDSASLWLTRVTAPRPPGPEPLPPPPSLSELPSLRFAPLEEDRDQRRPWPKRQLLIVGAVLGGLGLVAVAVAWLPRLEWFTRKASVAPAPVSTPSPQAQASLPPELQVAAEQLPHLAPETIRLVASTIDLGRPPEAPEVFRRADLAANRGASALTGDEARELRSLKSAAVGALRPIDRERVLAYDRVTVGRDLMLGEDARVLRLYAHGVRALPTPRRERLQVLLGKAIAAALVRNAPRTDAAPPTPETR